MGQSYDVVHHIPEHKIGFPQGILSTCPHNAIYIFTSHYRSKRIYFSRRKTDKDEKFTLAKPQRTSFTFA